MSSDAKNRDTAIDLFRILLMFLIVLHHAAYHGIWNHPQQLDIEHPSIYLLFTAITIWHVDGFIAITGWFGTKFSVTKLSKLLGVIFFYSIPSIIYGVISKPTSGSLECYNFIAGGWFGHLYVLFLFIVPFLNLAIDHLIKSNRNVIITTLLIFDIGMIFNWIAYSTFHIGGVCTTEGFSILTFISIYINVRTLRQTVPITKISGRHLLLGLLIFIFGLITSGSILTLVKTCVRHEPWSWTEWIMRFGWISTYNAPHVIIMAATGLLFFAKYITIPRHLTLITVHASSLMFGVYVIHETTSFGRQLYTLPQTWITAHFGLHPLISIFITAIICFLACIAMEEIRRVTMAPIAKFALGLTSTIDRWFCAYGKR